MKVCYRLSDSSNVRERVKGSTKLKCLENFLKNFHLSRLDSMFILADKVTDETYHNLQILTKNYPVEIKRSNADSEAGSFRLLLEEVVNANLPYREYVYFLEDDFIHLPNSRKILEEGLLLAD